MSTQIANMDPYVYPGTNVLRNLRDIRDRDLLSRFEMDMTTRRLSELARNPTVGQLDSQHIRAIHRHIFHDVYAWAGEFRTLNISKPGQFPFAFSHQIPQCIDRLSAELKRERYLERLLLSQFCSRAAHYMGEINAIHPFREGERTHTAQIHPAACRSKWIRTQLVPCVA